jgi:hypothetical protein
MGTPGRRRRLSVPFLALALATARLEGARPAAADDAPPPEVDARAARAKALEWLAKTPNADGSWGKTYTVAVTGLSCLAFLASSDEPFDATAVRDAAGALTHGLAWLVATAKDGTFPKQGHTWIHGQGFATLALCEAYGRASRAKTKPDLDLAALRRVAIAATTAVAGSQSTSGGWWYTSDSPSQHEGSTTVCAVQALVSATNQGFPVDAAILERGFEYLKRCQNPDGGFDYMEGPGTNSMKEGSAGDVATLALMKKFDYDVMVHGVDFLQTTGPSAISAERFPYYGHFYACMGLRLFGEEMAALPAAEAWAKAAWKDVLSWRQPDGSFPLKGWMVSSGGEGPAYSTAFAALILSVPEARLTILSRNPPPPPARPAEPPPAPSAMGS